MTYPVRAPESLLRAVTTRVNEASGIRSVGGLDVVFGA
jgi:hypothetical protein